MFYYHLVKILEGIVNSRCYELSIYTAFDAKINEYQNTSELEQLLRKALGRNIPPQYGIHYYVCEDHNARDQIASLHERRIVTNFVVLNLDDDLGGGAALQGIQVSTDENINTKIKDLWLEGKHRLPIIKEIHINR